MSIKLVSFDFEIIFNDSIDKQHFEKHLEEFCRAFQWLKHTKRVLYICLITNMDRKSANERLKDSKVSEFVDFIICNDVNMETIGKAVYALSTSRAYASDALFVVSNNENLKNISAIGTNVALYNPTEYLFELGDVLLALEEQEFTLNRFIKEMSIGISCINAEYTDWYAGVKPEKKNMYSVVVRRLSKIFKDFDPEVVLEIGTGRAQISTLLALSLKETSQIYTYDIANRFNYLSTSAARYHSALWAGNVTHVHLADYGYSSTDKSNILLSVQKELREEHKLSKDIDMLIVDGDLSREGVKSDLQFWIPSLSDNATIIITGAIHVHDAVKVLIDDICNKFNVYRFCSDLAYGSGDHNIGKETCRPNTQAESHIASAPDYASSRKIERDDFHMNDSGYNDKIHDISYELIASHPGIIVLKKSSLIKWSDILMQIDIVN
jgi:hypothetical protein